MAWRDFPLPDGTYSDVARPWSQQDIYNYLPVFAEQAGTRSRMKLACAPGLDIFASVGEGPHRGARDVEGTLFVVSGHTLYSVTPAGVVAALGTIPGTGPVCMTHNQITDGNEVVIGNRMQSIKPGAIHARPARLNLGNAAASKRPAKMAAT